MKKKSKFLFMLFAAPLFLMFKTACQKEDPHPIIETKPAYNVFGTFAVSGADVITVKGLRLDVKGVCWSTEPEPTIADSHTDDGPGSGSYSSVMQNLQPNTSYYYRAYVVTKLGTAYGNILKFHTVDSESILLHFDSLVQLTPRSFGFYATNNIYNMGVKVDRTGVCYAYGKMPDVNDFVKFRYSNSQIISELIQTGQGEPFTVRPFVELSIGQVIYGEAIEGFPGKLEISAIDRVTFRSARILIEHDESPYFIRTILYWGTEKENLDRYGFFYHRDVTQHYTYAYNLLPGTNYYVRPELTFSGLPDQYVMGNSVSDWADYESFTTPPVSDIGSGTYDAPYTIDGALYLAPFTEHIWVEGYIVGEFDRIGRHSNFSPPFVQEFAIMLANEIDEMFVGNTLWVTLPSGPISQALNLKDNPGNKGRKLRIQGNVYRDYKVYMNQIQEFELE